MPEAWLTAFEEAHGRAEKAAEEARLKALKRAAKEAVLSYRVAPEGSPLTKAQEKLGRANYSWADPNYLRGTSYNLYNAKNLPFQGNFGVGLANYGWNEENILDKIDYSRKKYQNRDKSGGYQQIFRNMRDWGNKYDPKLTSFLDTGEKPEGLNMDTVLQAADYGLRSTGQHQQHKKSFMNSPLGSLFKTVTTIAAAFVPVVGVPLAMAVGAGLGSMSGGGLRGAAMGAVSGYMAGGLPAQFGSGLSGMANMGRGIMSIPMNTGRYLMNIGHNIGRLGTGVAQGGLGTLSQNIGRFGRSIYNPASLQSPLFSTNLGNLSGVAPAPFTGLTKAPWANATYNPLFGAPTTVGARLGSVTGGGLGTLAKDVGTNVALSWGMNALTPKPDQNYNPYQQFVQSGGLMDYLNNSRSPYYTENNPYQNPTPVQFNV